MKTTYYIDPNRGCDGFSGTDPRSPWLSFAPLARLVLGPGDRVRILAPGPLVASLVIRGAGTRENPISVEFAPGRYDIHPAGLERRYYAISNNNDEPLEPKAVGVLVEEARHVRIVGRGARLVCRGKMVVACIDRSEYVALRGLQVDYHRPTVSEFTVLSATEQTAELHVHPDSHYAFHGGAITWMGEGWSYESGLAQELIPETGVIWRLRDPLASLRLDAVSPGHIRAHGAHRMVAGHVYQLRDTRRDCVGIFVTRSDNVRLQSLDLFYLHGMGIVGQFSRDILLDRVRLSPEPGSGRTCSVWADATHFSGCRGRIVLRNCLFDGAHDDAINVHGTYLRVEEALAGNQLLVRFMHPQTYGFLAVNPGDEIDFVRWDSMAIYGSSHVKAVEMLDDFALRVTLQGPLPSDLRMHDVIENATWTPRVEVRGCTIKRIPTRGFLLTTRQKVVVRENHFVRIFRNGINIEGDTSKWFESGSVRDMHIHHNLFEGCGREAILISPRHTLANAGVHRNIRITENTFVVPDKGCAVKACGTTGLQIRDNKVTLESPTPTFDRNLIVLNDCDQAVVRNNAFAEVDSPASGKLLNSH